MGVVRLTRIEALLQEREQLWAAGGNRDEAERIKRELEALYDARRRKQMGRGLTDYRGTTTAWARWSG